MRAFVIPPAPTGPDDLKRVDRPEPVPGEMDILVRIRAAALNYRDQHIVRNIYRMGKVEQETVPLSDGAGEVVAVGSGVTRFRPGDRVVGTFFKGWIGGPFRPQGYWSLGQGNVDGVLADLVVFNEENAVAVPDGLSFEEAACLPTAALTAWTALVTVGRMRLGHRVLMLGTGGVSLFALQFAAAAGAFPIITSSSGEKLERAQALGARGLVNYRTTPDWERPVIEMTGGAGADIVVEVAGRASLPHSFRALAPEGAIALIGYLGGEDDVPDPRIALRRGARMQVVHVGSRAGLEEMLGAIVVNGIRPVIDRVFPFEDTVEAYRYAGSGAPFGKVVIAL